jgi:Phage stabilisation protein
MAVPIPIPLASIKGLSTFASDERLINARAELVKDGKIAIYAAPGLTPLSSISGESCRCVFEVDGIMYSVNGDKLYAVTSNGASTLIGTISGKGRVRFARNAANPPQVLILSNLNMYVLQGNALTSFSSPNLPQLPIDIAWSDGYFIFVLADGRFFISGINNTAIAALDFASAESNPDGNVGIAVLRRELYIFGTQTTEVFANTGNSLFPFERLSGAVIQSGCSSRDSIVEVNGALFWLNEDKVIVTSSSYNVTIVSSRAVYDAVNALSAQTAIQAFEVTLGINMYYVLWSPEFTWVLDVSSGFWHERQTRGSNAWRGNNAVFAFQKQIVGSALDGSLYVLDETAYADGNTEMISTMRLPRMESFPLGGVVDQIEFDVETGVGRDVPGIMPDTVDPLCILSWSRDAGKTYVGGRHLSLGKKGEYRKRVRSTRLGSFGDKGIIFQLSISSNVFRCLLGASIMTSGVQT